MVSRFLSLLVIFLMVASPIMGAASALNYGNDEPGSNVDGSFKGIGLNPSSANSLTMIGDINGDGYADFASSAFGYNSGQGEAFIYFGKNTGWAINKTMADADA
jgi:hypothetical protein